MRDEVIAEHLRREIGSDVDPHGGPDGAIYSAEFFESHIGELTAFIPLSASAGDVGGLLPAGPVAVAVHRGSFSELDRTYTALAVSSPNRVWVRERARRSGRTTW